MIELRFITSRSIVSWLIRRLTWSDYSHVEFVLPYGYLGAQADGVKVRDFDYCKPTKSAICHVDCPPEVTRIVLDYAKKQVGKPYDFMALVGGLFHRDWKKSNCWFCSELVAACFAYAGYPLIKGPVNRVTPGMLFNSILVKWYVDNRNFI